MSDLSVREAQMDSGGRPQAEDDSKRASERLFVALALPNWLRAELKGLSEPLRAVAWIRPEQLHLTLRFLGDTPADKIDRIMESLASIHVESFILPIEGVGVFPLKGPPRSSGWA